MDQDYPADLDPRVEALVTEVIGRVAAKWTMIVLECVAVWAAKNMDRIAAARAGFDGRVAA